jgi:transposase-like protein
MTKNKQHKGKKWRRLYRYTCTMCQKIRYVKTYERFKGKVCTLCLPKPVDENQGNLLDALLAEQNNRVDN